MRKLLMAALFAVMTGQASAQDLKIRDVFKQMPDSIMPSLSHNNRLDFIDFLDSNMKAEVKNLLGGSSEMTALSDDSLSIQMSASLRTDLLLMKLAEPVDSISQVVVMIETFLIDSLYGESAVRYFTVDWHPFNQEPSFNIEQRNRINEHIVQNLLKREEDLLNKS